ncbi:MAG TPA: DNA-binding protein [Thermoanaerobaculia bacterium]|nr:DNA-binding protein [Thermoanaerobaculia bacterium]
MRRAFARSAARQVLVLALALLPAAGPAGAAELKITAQEAAQHAGEQAKVCGLVAGAKYAERSRGKPTFLDFERSHPAEVFKAVIWGADRGKFKQPPETTYDQQQVCVTGRIELYHGVPEIIVRSPSQLAIAPGHTAKPGT